MFQIFVFYSELLVCHELKHCFQWNLSTFSHLGEVKIIPIPLSIEGKNDPHPLIHIWGKWNISTKSNHSEVKIVHILISFWDKINPHPLIWGRWKYLHQPHPLIRGRSKLSPSSHLGELKIIHNLLSGEGKSHLNTLSYLCKSSNILSSLWGKNPAYGRQRISRPMRIDGPILFWVGSKR